MPPNVSTAARTDDDALVLFAFDRAYNGLPAPRIPISIPSVSPKGTLIDWKNKVLVFLTDRDVSGTLSLRFRCKMAMVELGLLLESVSQCIQDRTNKLL